MEKKWCRRYAWVFSLIVLECMACSAEKKISTVDALWPAYTFEEAVEDAETIIYGKVTGKGDTQVEEHVISENKTFREYYRTVTIEVIERIKGDGDSILLKKHLNLANVQKICYNISLEGGISCFTVLQPTAS